jgi:hypothetical protein
MKQLFRVLSLAAALLWGAHVLARPLLIAPKHLYLPLGDLPRHLGIFPDFFSVAIDGDTVLASANRPLNMDNERISGVYIFERAADGNWAYVGPLTEGSEFRAQVLMSGGVATVYEFGAFRIFERGAAGWTQTANIAYTGYPFRVENGAVYARQESYPPTCQPPFDVFRKVNGTWQAAATIGGQRCEEFTSVDVNDGRALVVHRPNNYALPQPPADIFRNTGASSWPLVGALELPPPNPPFVSFYGAGATLNGNYAFLTDGYLYRNSSGETWTAFPKFVAPEIDTGIYSGNGGPYLRGNYLFIPGSERDYFTPSHDIDVTYEKNTVRLYRPTANGTLPYYARLNPDFDLWQWAVSEDGRRVVGASPDNDGDYDPVSMLYVFEIPDSTSFPALQQDTFEAGNYARWTASGGQFEVAQSNGTRVLRQSSLTGGSGATLTAIDWTDQSIEADLRPLEFAETGRWLGLVTRRTDAQNYYYVTLRSPNVVSLRRVRAGVVTELGARGVEGGFVPGRSYRLRLESVGDQQAVFLDGLTLLTVKDTTLTHGHPGFAGYRTRFEVDNVIVTGGTRLLMAQDSVDTFFSVPAFNSAPWQQITIDDEQDSFHSYRRQTATEGDQRVFMRTSISDQVVSARMQPLAYGTTTGTQDPWFGIAARVVDDNNYLYMTLRRSNQLSLRRVINGSIQVLGTAPLTVSTNQWYDLRLLVIGNRIRAYVNGDLKLEVVDPTLPSYGRSGVLMYKTSADLRSFISYQP